MSDDREPADPSTEDGDAIPRGRFYRGTILRVHYGRGSGLVRTGNGREIPFAVPFVEFLDGRRIEDLAEGMEIGFDVGWTSRGLRVTTIKL